MDNWNVPSRDFFQPDEPPGRWARLGRGLLWALLILVACYLAATFVLLELHS